MRILLTTRGSSGHVLPLAPLGHAALAAGHDVLVAAQRQHEANVARTGLPFAPVGDPPAEEWMPLMADFAQLDIDRANAAMIGEFFARIDTRAALPELRAIVADYRPDVIVRESWEFASTLVAEPLGIPLARVALGLASVEELTIALASPTLDELRAELGLAPDPDGERLRETPILSAVPELLDDHDPALAAPPRRFSPGAAATIPSLPLADWWEDEDRPLVYVTFGSVTAAEHLPYYPDLYAAAIESLEPLDARVLVTLGEARDPRELGPLPRHVHVERWVPQDAIATHAAAIVTHGGYGSTLGSLRHGVPLVVVPLFSVDQWANAAAVQRVGAGIALDADRHSRTVLGLPAPEVMRGLGPAIERVLAEPSYRAEARRIAAADRASSVCRDGGRGALRARSGAVAAGTQLSSENLSTWATRSSARSCWPTRRRRSSRSCPCSWASTSC